MKLASVRRYALSLPETSEEPHFHMTSFRVMGRIFATAPAQGEHLHVFVPEEEREQALMINPAACEKLWWGKKVAGLRVLLAQAKPDEVRRLLLAAWKNKAPKKLAGSIG